MGLDLGTNSIGWALVRQGDPLRIDALEGCGVRIFEPSVEDGWEHTPKNKGRRDARGARRTIQRAANRRKQLRKQLVEAGLLPDLANAKQPEKALDEIGDPYDLRKRALDERLEPHQVGRVLLHLCARRGFLSNRKTRWQNLMDWDETRDLIAVIEQEEERQRKDKTGKSAAERKEEEEQGKIIKELAGLRNAIKVAGARTLGVYLAGLPEGERKRARHTDRQMHQEEFEEVWAEQAKRHPGILTDDLKARVHTAIFHQRPLKLDGGRIGNCSLEPQLPRAAWARLESQRFRLLQDVNNLEVAGVFQADRPIGLEQRRQLADALEQDSFASWAVVRRTLFGGAGQKVKMNMEVAGSKDKGLTGNRTAAALRRIIQWDAYDDERRKRLVNDLITITDKRDLFKCLRRKWGFEPKTALRLAVAELEEGHANLSLKAINNLLPHMEQGKRFDQARQAVASESSSESVKVLYGYETPESEGAEFLGAPPDDLRNPAVEKALHELRKVVNAVIRTYGRPDVIRVELTRDLKRSKKGRERIEKQQSENRRANERARQAFERIHPGETPSGNDLIKHRLWREQGEECAYTVGNSAISESELFSPEVEIDHIIPYSLHPDDSYINKVVCMRGKNREKGNKTPWQAFGDAPDWEEMTQRVKRWEKAADKRFRFPPAKAARFVSKDTPTFDGFLNRQLPDTGYIGREATKHLEQLSGVTVDVTKGGATSRLRSLWALNAALGGPPGEKNRSDHRHHALDAVVIAVTTHSVYRNIAKIAEENVVNEKHSFTRGATPEAPWNGFSQEVKSKIACIVVSHAPFRKLSGPLHKDTAYGLRSQKENGDLVLHYRKPLLKLTHAMVNKIADEELKSVVQHRVKEANLKGRQEAGDAFKDYSLMHPRHPNGRPVRRVRILENSSSPTPLLGIRPQGDPDDVPFKYHPYENTHHVEIFLDTHAGKVESRFVTMMEAAARARSLKTPIVAREWDGYEFLMSLAKNDMVVLDEDLGNPYRVQDLDAGRKRLRLRHHKAASISKDSTAEEKSADKREPPIQVRRPIVDLLDERKMRKVNVSPLGELRRARD